MMTNTETKRNRNSRNGRYVHDYSALCKCGHPHGVHLAGTDNGAHDCDNANWGDGTECDCSKFRAVR